MMRLKIIGLCAVASWAILPGVAARAQEAQQPDDEIVRGAFVTTRPAKKEAAAKPSDANAKAAANIGGDAPAEQKSAKAQANKTTQVARANTKAGGPRANATKTNAPKANAADTDRAESAKSSAGSQGGAKIVRAAARPAGIGVGYTVFRRDDLGEAVRVDARREFHTGEAVRLLVESNADGYLYIFDAEDDAAPSLIFPNAKLKGGDNRISAHVPYEIPSGAEADESLRWFVFNETPATERVYIIVSRRPLEGVPTGEGLVKFCAGRDATCAWKPAPDEWVRLRGANRGDEIAVSRARDEGLSQTAAEHEAASRGLGLSAGAPPPTVIYIASSADANVLVTAIDLIHRK
jgi:hypothetical protein